MKLPALFVMFLVLVLGSLGAQAPLTVYASTGPQAWIVGRIGGPLVQAQAIIKPGMDAHTYDASPREIQRLGSAKAIFITGLEFEKNIVEPLKRVNPRLPIIDLRQGIQLRTLEAHWEDPTLGHSHGEGNRDPHIWLGIPQVRIQAATIRDGLISLMPGARDQIQRRYEEFMVEVQALDQELGTLLTPLQGSAVLVYHPAFGYFTDYFGLTQLAIEAGGREPSPRLLQQTIEKSLAAGVRVIFTQPEYESAAARAVARAIGARTVAVTDLDDEWPRLMRNLARALSQGRL